MSCDPTSFEFDVTTDGFFCVHRFVDDVGLSLGSFACVRRSVLLTSCDMTISDCLRPYQLYSQEILASMAERRNKYRAIVRQCSESRETKSSFHCPW